MKTNNNTQVLIHLVDELNIPVTHKTVRDELLMHPDAGSMLAFSDLLNAWRVPNGAYELTFGRLTEVPLPFIAFTNKGFVTVIHIDDQQVTLSNEKYTYKNSSVEEFKKSYSGSVLAVEKNTNSGEPDYKKNRRKEIIDDLRLPVFFAGAFVLLVTFLLFHSAFASSFGLQTGLLTLFKTAGLAASVLLLIQSIDTNNPLVQKLCGGDNNRDCNAILSSKAAKINDHLSWSEVGFFYLAGTWLALLFNSGSTPILQVLAILNIISLPYTFYSIYYQWRVAKQWCMFCCTVQAVLWLEFFAFVPYLSNGIQLPSLQEWTSLATAIATPVLIWIFIKPFLLQAQQVDPLKQQLHRFKYNTDLFEKLLNEEVKYSLPAEEHSLIVGNREAEHIITMVSNPYCPPCAKTHKALDEWLDGREDIKLQVVFSTQNNEKDKKTEVAAHLMSLQNNRDDKSLKKALNDWYGQKQKNYQTWAKEHPVKNNDGITELLETQKQWCKMAEITATPTLFLNGRRVPKNYQPEDLKYFI